ncbi:hypothetical protein KHQ81_12215 [Mycoplasmatota bacterium]|nr:hypothetical protein KHQ81_12215 [Mycoplasmatota bacterium]
MKKMGFNELKETYSIPYENGDIKEALRILHQGEALLEKKELEKNEYILILDKAKFNSLLNLYDDCLNYLTYLVKRGYVCPLHWRIFANPFFKNKSYIKLIEKNDFNRRREQENTSFKWEILLPENYTEEKKYPLFINLHGDGDCIEDHKEFWKADKLLNKNFIVVYLQSRQLTRHNGYAWLKRVFYSTNQKDWPDSEKIYPLSKSSYLVKTCYESANNDLEVCYRELIKRYSIDQKKIIIGGFSGGATASIEFTLANRIPIKGFISLCAQKPTILTDDTVKSAAQRGVKAVFLEGEEDTPVIEVEEMIETFKRYNLKYRYHINQEIGHWYPDDLENQVEKAVDYILA